MGLSIKKMIEEVPTKRNLVDRHFHLLHIVEETYKRRKNRRRMRQLCEEVGRKHVREFTRLSKALLAENAKYSSTPTLPMVPTFERLATVLSENGEFSAAIRVCRRAISFGLHDGTKDGYEGRIQRIRSLRDRCKDGDAEQIRAAKRKKPRRAKSDRRQTDSGVPRFKRYFATEKDMRSRQKGFYQRWRDCWRKDDALPVDGNISYLFAYTYTVLERGPKLAIPELRRLVRAYRALEPEFAKYCQGWLSDCFVALGDYAKALRAFPTLDPDARSSAGTDNLLSLKKRLGKRLAGRDVLTLNGPKVAKWGRENLSTLQELLDVLVAAYERHKKVNLIQAWASEAYTYPYFVFGGSAYSRACKLKAFQFSAVPDASRFVAKLAREAEDTALEEAGLPKVGEGWIAETNLFYKLQKALRPRRVTHHARPKWLGHQHLDIYIPSLRVAVEYQGAQHDEPVEYFGGEKAFKQTKRRDRMKARKCWENGIRLLYARPGYRLRDLIAEIYAT